MFLVFCSFLDAFALETSIVQQGDGEKPKVQEVSMDVIDQNVVVQATLVPNVNDAPLPFCP
jgi:hypothetical protein